MDSNYCDTLFHNVGISTGENTIDLLFSGVDQCFTDGYVEELSAKKNATTHDMSMAGDRYVELSSGKQSLRKQTGGYFLRKRKTNSPPSNKSSVSGKS